MRIIASIFFSLLILSCGESGDDNTKRLSEINQHNKNGTVQYWKYSYDNIGRITTVTNYIDDGQPAVANISYDTDTISIVNHPTSDPLYNQTTEVLLVLNENGEVQKRIEFTNKIPVSSSYDEEIIYDTLSLEYDNTGFLKSTTRKRWTLVGTSSRTRTFNNTTYVVHDGNQVSFDEYDEAVNELKTLPTDQFGLVSKYITERRVEFEYNEAYPNKKVDLKNAAILNEFRPFYTVPPINSIYKNLPDNISIQSGVIKDENDQVLMYLGGLIAKIERTYKEGKLSSEEIVDGTLSSQVGQINYVYSR